MKEFDTYKAVYCGLCKQLGKDYGRLSTFTLSYDFTFLAMIFLGISDERPSFKKERCTVNPLKKKACLSYCGDLSFCASSAMTMFYYKLEDNYVDGKFADKAKVLSVKPYASSIHKKSAKEYPEVEVIVKECMQSQLLVEKSENPSLDAAAEPSSNALGRIMQLASTDEKVQRILNRLGYLIGRYVYLIDALDDLDSDISKDNFNVYNNKMKSENMSLEDVKLYAKESINLTISQIALAYELLDFKRYKTILDNIIYLGLHDTLTKVINREEKVNDKSI